MKRVKESERMKKLGYESGSNENEVMSCWQTLFFTLSGEMIERRRYGQINELLKKHSRWVFPPHAFYLLLLKVVLSHPHEKSMQEWAGKRSDGESALIGGNNNFLGTKCARIARTSPLIQSPFPSPKKHDYTLYTHRTNYKQACGRIMRPT